MYARQLSFQSSPDNRPQVEALADRVYARMKTMNGFVAVHFLISPDQTSFGAFSLWQTLADAETAGDDLRAFSRDTLQQVVTAAPTEAYFEVYRPKSNPG